jgi:serine/threonine-protein kinase
MSALALRVERGAQRGMEFVFEQGDDVVIGRDVPDSPAQVRLDPADRTVSRLHCVLEVRGPETTMLRDLGSKHGTQLCRSGSHEWRAVPGRQPLHDGDQICVGGAVLAVRLAPEPTPEPSALCIRCQGPIVVPSRGSTFVMQARDYLCPRCQAEQTAAAEAAVSVVECDECRADVTSLATSDGRAEELGDVSTYLCPACAERFRELMRQQIGPVLLLSQVGVGGMGVVYRGWDTRSGRVVALKQVLRPVALPPAMMARFLREIALLQQLNHPNITRFIEAGQHDGVPFFVSEFVPDGDLSAFVSPQGRPLLSVPASVRLVSLALTGVAHAHAAGIVHRDLKPENILLSRTGRALTPKVADFGLSRSYERHGGTVTLPGEFAGTLHYLPPEQVTSFAHCGPAVDVYAMGSCLYYLLTGRHPLVLPEPWQLDGHDDELRHEYPGLTDEEVLRRVLEHERIPVRERRPDVPVALAGVVDRAVARDVSRRLSSAEQMRVLLAEASGSRDG